MKAFFARILLVAFVLAATFLGGYLMGGSRTIFDKRRAPSESDAFTFSALRDEPSKRIGVTEPMANGQFGETKREPWTRERLVQTMTKLLPNTSESATLRPMLRFTEQLEATDFPLALEAVKDLKTTWTQDRGERLLLIRWAEVNPRAAADYLLTHLRPNSQNEISYGSFTDVLYPIWVQADAGGAISWARGLKDAKERERHLAFVIRSLGERNPEAVVDFVKANAPQFIQNGELRPGLVEGVGVLPPEEAARHMAETKDVAGLQVAVERWAQSDAPAALAWAEKLEDPEQRGDALAEIVRTVGERDPAAAAAAFTKVANRSDALDVLVAGIIAGWVRKDLPAARAWAAQLPEGSGKNTAYQTLGDKAEFRDRVAIEQWVESLPKGATRDAATAGFLSAGGKAPGAEAMNMALALAEPKLRENSFRTLARRWFDSDPGAALEWLQSDTGLPAEEKRKLLQKR